MSALVQANWLDRAIAAVAPRTAARRLHGRYVFETMSRGYTGGRRDRRATKRWRLSRGDADKDSVPDLDELRVRSRDLSRNMPIATGVVRRQRQHVVGSGLMPRPQIDRDLLRLSEEQAALWERQAEREFRLHALSRFIDRTGRQNYLGLQKLVFGGQSESGDCFSVRRFVEPSGDPGRIYGTAYQVFEADQVSTPSAGVEGRELDNGHRIVAGVETDAGGRVVAYWFQKRHPSNIQGEAARDWSRAPAFDAEGRALVRQHYDQERIGQSRGIPELAPVIEALKQLGDYGDAELRAAVVGALFTVFVKTESGEGMDAPESATGTPATGDYELGNGAILDLRPNESIEVANPGRPNADFEPFFIAVVKQIGAALALPFEVLILHFTASYSASRAAIEMAWQVFRQRRADFIQGFSQPVYEDILTEGVARGRLAAPGFFADPLVRQAWLLVVFTGPRKISIRPDQEFKAYAEAEDRGWVTAEENTAEITGGDWHKKIPQRKREEALKRDAGLGATAPASEPPPSDQDRDAQERPEDETQEAT